MDEVVYMRQKDLAKRLGLSQQRISQLVQRGLPLLKNGYLELGLSLCWLKANSMPSRSRHPDRGVCRVNDLLRD